MFSLSLLMTAAFECLCSHLIFFFPSVAICKLKRHNSLIFFSQAVYYKRVIILSAALWPTNRHYLYLLWSLTYRTRPFALQVLSPLYWLGKQPRIIWTLPENSRFTVFPLFKRFVREQIHESFSGRAIHTNQLVTIPVFLLELKECKKIFLAHYCSHAFTVA